MSKPPKKKARSRLAAVLVALVFGAYGLAELTGFLDPGVAAPARADPARTGGGEVTRAPSADGTRAVLEAYAARRSNVVVEAGGIVTRTLPDDSEGSRHQRFVVRLDDSDHTVLIAHNIDLADRVPLSEGDRVAFRGEFEWNDRGGVVHWTHHDPGGRRPGGWIRHRDATYR